MLISLSVDDTYIWSDRTNHPAVTLISVPINIPVDNTLSCRSARSRLLASIWTTLAKQVIVLLYQLWSTQRYEYNVTGFSYLHCIVLAYAREFNYILAWDLRLSQRWRRLSSGFQRRVDMQVDTRVSEENTVVTMQKIPIGNYVVVWY
jgi:hypothetical protein